MITDRHLYYINVSHTLDKRIWLTWKNVRMNKKKVTHLQLNNTTLLRLKAQMSFWKTATIHIQIIKQYIQTKCANKLSVEPSIFRQYQRLCCGSNKTEQALNWISWSYIIHHKALTLLVRLCTCFALLVRDTLIKMSDRAKQIMSVLSKTTKCRAGP